MHSYVVGQGDCIESIAAEFGLPWKNIWNDQANAELQKRRGNPNVLLTGDIVVLPELNIRSENCATNMRHHFVVNRQSSDLVLFLKDFGKPRAHQPYTLSVDGVTVTGKTDESGKLTTKIPAGAKRGRLSVGPVEAREEYLLKFGHIDPLSEGSGVEGRLRNLGYESLSDFQQRHRLPSTGKADEITLDHLRIEYGC